MEDTEKTKNELLAELMAWRQRAAQLEQQLVQCQPPSGKGSRDTATCADRVVALQQLQQEVLELQQVEKQLQRYQLLSEHSRDIALYVGLEGQILEANQAAVIAYGYEREQLLSLNIADLRSLQTHTLLPQQLKQASQEGILFETLHRRRDGTVFPVEVSAQSTIINDEKVILSIIRDISERKQAERDREVLLIRSQAAEQRAKFLAEASTVLTSSLDYEHTLKSVAQLAVPTLADWCVVDILNADQSLERLATAHADPAKVEWATELYRRYPPDLNAPQGLAQVLRTGQSEYYPEITDDQLVAGAYDSEHLEILRQVGFKSVMIVPLIARGKILGAISFVTTQSGHAYSLDDLTLAEELARRAAIALDNARLYQQAQEAQQAAERAADRKARLQEVTAALSEVLTPTQVAEVIAEQSMAALAANSALIALLTEDRTELEIVCAVGYAPNLVESWRRFSVNTAAPLAEAVRTGEPVWAEPVAERIARYPHLTEAYQRYEYQSWISLPLMVEGRAIGGMSLSFQEFYPMSQDDHDFILALTRQCAQAIARAQLYEAEQNARTQAEQANRIKDEFLAVLSHELRSPLNPILGWTKLLRQRQFDQKTTDKALETIERNAKLQSQLIEDLLDVSRILRGKMVLNITPVNLVTPVEAALETVRLSATAKSIQIQTLFDPKIGYVNGDSNRLQQVVWNLLSNAVKFTPPGGRVEVRVERVDAYAHIQVKDTGIGISSDFLPHVFEYFRQQNSTTTRQFGGLGLGLAIVRYLVELHGGSVIVESPGEGLGATFTVRFPLMKTDPNKDHPQVPSKELPDLRGLRVLVVDDEADMRELTTLVLEQAGAVVTLASSASEALTALHQSLPDLLIADIGMPEVDGYMLIRQVRTLSPKSGGKIPAIALTAYAGELNQQQALEAGFQLHLAKPIEPQHLLQAIATLHST